MPNINITNNFTNKVTNQHTRIQQDGEGQTMGQTLRKGIAVLGASMVLGAPLALAQAPTKELSEKSVITLMNYAWTILPTKFTTPERKTIEVDKTKRDALVPVDVGREIIKVGYVSAQAQMCEMWDEQNANFSAMIAKEQAKKTWTDQQLLYITTLHRLTIHFAAGKMRLVEKGSDELQVFLEPIEPTKGSCTDDKRRSINQTIAAYVKTSPIAKTGEPPPEAVAATPPAATAQPVPAAQKK